MSAEIFKGIQANITSNPAVAKSVNGVYQFNVATSAGEQNWTVDLKTNIGVKVRRAHAA
jgi:hypothetical protein